MNESTFTRRQQAGRSYSGSKLPTVHGLPPQGNRPGARLRVARFSFASNILTREKNR
jgi:hypothetical protein